MNKNSGLYVHIPFCDHKCIYCDFYSIITKDNFDAFLDSLKKEILFYSTKYSAGRTFSSIFFGGGTPSLMSAKYIGEIISSLKENFSVNDDAEITLETNPGTVDKNKFKDFHKEGINRISIGIQSFDEQQLKFLTRIHNKEKAIATVYQAVEAGFENISIDLIFNLPGQTKEKWTNNLNKALALPVKHISAYSLILERGTILNKMVLDGKVKMQDEDYDADLYEITIDKLIESGFHQYEVSNFTKPGFECVHNNAYWRYRDYLSFGTSAHSFVNGGRWWNYSSLKKYISEIELNGHAKAGGEILSANDSLNEYVMLALRSSGLDTQEFRSLFGESWLKSKMNYFKELENYSFLKITDQKISLTKKGYLICDEILEKL
ncbi:MAG TPA: radical SAM family heme chaperone HemW [Ignavibacteriaceae bacterium]|nr:radical SAM family heme chaperone HemW [Ignavibacteriaceae bacterium]